MVSDLPQGVDEGDMLDATSIYSPLHPANSLNSLAQGWSTDKSGSESYWKAIADAARKGTARSYEPSTADEKLLHFSRVRQARKDYVIEACARFFHKNIKESGKFKLLTGASAHTTVIISPDGTMSVNYGFYLPVGGVLNKLKSVFGRNEYVLVAGITVLIDGMVREGQNIGLIFKVIGHISQLHMIEAGRFKEEFFLFAKKLDGQQADCEISFYIDIDPRIHKLKK